MQVIRPSDQHLYGPLQVGIHVQNGKITRVWPVQQPTGQSEPYTLVAVPKLVAETLKSQGKPVAVITRATETSLAWNVSLSSAMHKAFG